MTEDNNAILAMQFLENMAEVMDMLDGYRSSWVRRGYSEAAAEQMTVHMHEVVMKNIGSQVESG